MNKSKRQLARFISDNKLSRKDGLIVFDAAICFAREGKLQYLDSEVQVVSLPTHMAVYITEFFRPEYQHKEMYKTTDIDFVFPGGNVLHAWLGSTLILTIIVK